MFMFSETSNLNTYSKEQLSLLIECIDKEIMFINNLIIMRNQMIDDSDDMSERLETELRFQMGNKHSKLEELYGLRVAVMNAHQFVGNQIRIEQQ